MTSNTMNVQKLQSSLDNIIAQVKLEKAPSQAKDNRIKSLEDLVIEIVCNPNDVKVKEKLIKKKNEYIASLKKQLKLTHLEHPNQGGPRELNLARRNDGSHSSIKCPNERNEE